MTLTLTKDFFKKSKITQVNETNITKYIHDYRKKIKSKKQFIRDNKSNNLYKKYKKNIIQNLDEKLKMFKPFRSKFSLVNPIYLKINSNYLKVCFLKCKIYEEDKISEKQYFLHIANIKNIVEVIKGKTLWSGYFLSFKFNNIRLPDEYNSIQNLFLFSQNQEEFLFGLKVLFKIAQDSTRITIQDTEGKNIALKDFAHIREQI